MSIKRIAIAAALAAGLATTASAETLKYLTFKSESVRDPQTLTVQWFADEFAKRTGGQHEIEIFWGGSVANQREMPDAIESGVGDLGDIVIPYFPDKFALNNVIPVFMPQPKDEIQLSQKYYEWLEEYDAFSEEMARYNLKIVGLRASEQYGLLCSKPVRTAEDLKGLRIRTYGFALPQLIRALEATPVSMVTGEVYEAFERGILDCTAIGATLARSWRYDEVAKYFIDVKLGASWGHVIAMNLEKYNSLDEQAQSVIDGLAREYQIRFVEETNRLTREIRADWEANGVETIPFPADVIPAAVQAEGVQAVREEWLEKARAAGLPADEIEAFFAFE